MRINMTTELTSMSGEPVTNEKGSPMTVRQALFIALEAPVMEKDASGTFRAVPPTMKDMMQRIELVSAIRADDANLSIEQAKALQDLVRVAVAVPVAVPLIIHLEGEAPEKSVRKSSRR